MTRELQEWIKFDKKSRRFSLHPTIKTSLGVTLVKVLLDDSKDKNEYYLSFLVLEEDKKVPHKEDPEKPVDIIDDPTIPDKPVDTHDNPTNP